jgi:hypothetical protein
MGNKPSAPTSERVLRARLARAARSVRTVEARYEALGRRRIEVAFELAEARRQYEAERDRIKAAS